MFKAKQKWIGIGLVAATLLISGYVTFFKQGRGGLELLSDRGDGSAVGAAAVPEEMKALTDLYRTINLVQKRYIDAGRINPKAMFVGALTAIQLNVARVMVVESDAHVTVKVASREKQFDLTDLKTPWVLLQRIKEVFTFIKEEASDEELDLSDIEYAAINGMLKTLDPHSVFLNPDQYREMKDKTHGNFAGLGIVISIRDGVLTIISPIDGTPADVAGLEAGDQIIKIDDESTVNMSLNDAVDLLRGDPGTRVTVHIMRKGWAAAKPFSIERAIVKVESLETHLLAGKVGYVRIKDFQGNTAEDIHDILGKWTQKNVRGLVLDLRGCPGGLLEAAVQVSDLFLREGVIVTTAGQSPGDRDIRRAVDSGEEPTYPIVVIVDQGSASASEILAGALKNHDRALVIGEQTFGKGSVQVLFEFHESHLPTETTALKLTTAQYLTPGDISIQSVGVVPHIGVLPMRADEEMIDLKIDGGYRESDLSHHFEVARAASETEKPQESLSYLWTPPKSAKKAGEEGEEEDAPLPLPEKDKPFEPDYVTELAKDLVRQLNPTADKIDDGVFDSISGLLNEKRRLEEKRLVTALRKLNIDWQPAPETEIAAVADIELDVNKTETVTAGEEATLTVSVKNSGPGTFYRLEATSHSDFRPFDDRELAFGKVGPFETISRTLTFPVPKDALMEVNDILWTFDGEGAPAPDPAAVRFSVIPLKRPHFAYSYRTDDSKKGNGDGLLQVGESVDLVLQVKNIGEGTSLNTYATLKSLSDKSLFLIRGREPLEEIPPDTAKTAAFSFEIKPEFSEETARLELALADVDLREYLVDKLAIPVYPAAGGKSPKTGTDGSPKGFNSAPKLVFDDMARVTRNPTITLKGKAEDASKVRDLFIFVDDKKVFFKSNDETSSPSSLAFEAELPINKGINYITVVTEKNSDLQARHIIAVRRDRADHMPFLLSRTTENEVNPLGVLPLNSSAFNAMPPESTPPSPLSAATPAMAPRKSAASAPAPASGAPAL